MSKDISTIGGNAIIYSYPNGDTDIVCAASKWLKPPGWEDAAAHEVQQPRPKGRKADKRAEGDDAVRSMRRARAKLRRLALSNSFDYFVTLTLSPEEVDRYDAKAIMAKVNRWLDNMVRRSGLRYILVPEEHEKGGYHFHGFFAGAGLKVVDSGTIKRPGWKKPWKWSSEEERDSWLAEGGHVVYNLPQWGLGFTTAMSLHGEYSAAVAYVCKYIGKQQGQRPMGRWYYSGGALAEPMKEYATLEYRELAREFEGEAVEFTIPGSQMLVIHHKGGKGNVEADAGL